MSEPNRTTTAPELDLEQQASLLALVCAAVNQTARGEALRLPRPAAAWLEVPAAVFVTLWQGDPPAEPRLRGCIGRFTADHSLYLAAVNAAVGAASRDPRFPPVTVDELPGLTVEISLLSAQTLVSDLEDLVLGRDGVIIEACGRQALLLPAVAPRLGWSKTELLHSVCRKAGLPEDTWPALGKLYRFEVCSFSRPAALRTQPEAAADHPTIRE